MSPLDLIRSRDGSMSLTKLAAATFHLSLAVSVAWVTFLKRDFIEAMWLLYAGFAVGHAVVDKTSAQISAFKDRQLDADASPSMRTSTTTTIKEPVL